MASTMNRSILDVILDHKRTAELPARKRVVDERAMRNRAEAQTTPARDFGSNLLRPDGRVALIAEIKRASPSKGDLVKGEFNPVETALLYQSHGASAISVLTDARFFK